MQRCDFASIMAIIRGDLMDGAFTNQMDLVETIFSAFTQERENAGDEFYFDPGLVNRWFNGLAKLSPVICQFYTMSPANQNELAVTLEDALLPYLSDQAMVIQHVYELLTRDPSVSEEKKTELSARRTEGDSVFLSAVLTFGMGRPFVARDIRKPEEKTTGKLSPPIQDYIFDEGVSKPCRSFCGREKELEQLHDALVQNDKVFLQGIPGIGKSELAKAYAKSYKKEYTNILYLIYSGSLKRDIAELQFADDKETDNEDKLFHRHNRFLRTLKEDTLLIIDNFNTTAAQEELLPIVMKYYCRILFTTKSTFAEHSCVTVEEISDHRILYDMFSTYFRDAEHHRDTVEAIMETVHYHTLSIELAARLLQSGLLTPEQVLSKLREEKASFNGEDTIKISKDGKTVRATYYQHINTLFSLFRLDQRQGYAMQCMSMMPLSGIPARLFAKWIGFTDLNTVNELAELGFIRMDESRDLSLHPMMRDVTVADLTPSVNSCRTLLINIGNFCCQHHREVPHSRLIKQIIENTIEAMKKDDCNFYVSFLEQVYVSISDPSRQDSQTKILDELERLLSDEAVGAPEDRSALLSYLANQQRTSDKQIALLHQAIDAFPKPTKDNAHELYHLHDQIADAYRRTRKLDAAGRHMDIALRLAAKYGGIHDESRLLAMGYACLLNDTGKPRKALEVISPLEQLLRDRAPNTYEHAAVLRKLAAITANCGNIIKGLTLLDESWSIYKFLCGDDEERLQHFGKIIDGLRSGIFYVRDNPGRGIGGI